MYENNRNNASSGGKTVENLLNEKKVVWVGETPGKKELKGKQKQSDTGPDKPTAE